MADAAFDGATAFARAEPLRPVATEAPWFRRSLIGLVVLLVAILLLAPLAAQRRLRHRRRLGDRQVRLPRQGGAHHPHRPPLLSLAGGREDAAIALHHAGNRQSHAGVAGGPLDDRAARLQQTGPLGVLDHPHRHPVLDRIAGIEGFELYQHGSVDHTAGDSIDADHRRIADDVEDRAGNRGQRHTHDVT